MAECPCDRGTESAARLWSWMEFNNQQQQKSLQRFTKHEAVRDTRDGGSAERQRYSRPPPMICSRKLNR